MDTNLFGDTPVDLSLTILREFEPPEGYYGAFSGGKDSVVLKRLVEMAGVKCDWHYQVTTLDPPPLMEFIRDFHRDVKWEKPKHSFYWHIRHRHGLPSRTIRWCCHELKEPGGEGRLVLTGVRAEESSQRRGRHVVEPCQRLGKTFISPILHWTTNQIWQFIKEENLPYCRLYDEGWKRVGCCFCPFAHEDEIARTLAAWPRMAERILDACRYAWEHSTDEQLLARRVYSSPEEWFEAYLARDRQKRVSPDQEVLPFDQFGEDDDSDYS